MATYDQIMTALRNADAAGDTAAATRLAQMARAAQPTPSGAVAQPDPSSLNDGQTGFAEQTMSGVNEGIAATLGFPVDAVTGGVNGVSGLINQAFGTQIPAIENPRGGSQSVREMLARTISEDQPQTTAQRYGRSAGREVGAAVIPAGAAVRGAATIPQAVGRLVPPLVSAIGGGAGSQVARDAAPGSLMAEVAGNVIGSVAAPLAVNGLSRGAQRVVSPFGGADPDRVAAADYLRQRDVNVTAGQEVASDTLRRMEAGTGAGRARLDLQDEQFTQAALRAIGEDAPRATPDVMRQASARIGGEFDAVLGGTRLAPSSAEAQRAAQAIDTYNELAPAATATPLIANVADRISDAAQRGQPIDAETARAWRTRLGRAMAGANDDATRTAAGDLIEIVDDMTDTALQAAGRPDDVARLATARQQYRDFLALERAAAGAGENTAAGILSPARIRSAVAGQGRRSYTQGKRGELGELARAGATVLGRPNSSGTAENLGTVLRAALAIGGTTVGGIPGGAAAVLAPWAANRSALSAPLQAWLRNQIANPQNIVGKPDRITDAIRIGSGLFGPQ